MPTFSNKLTTPAATTPISVADVKEHLRIAHSTEDDLLETYLLAATELVQNMTGLQFCEAVFTWTGKYKELIELPTAPVVSVDSAEYLDANGDWVAFTTFTTYLSNPSYVHITEVPAYDSSKEHNIRIAYTVGVDTEIPEMAKIAIKTLVGQWYLNREGLGNLNEMPHGVKRICDALRVY